ncbi:MAG TPA: hypothetical protein VFR19_25350 [Hyphomicrobiaceae bacterium]|jgi:hypothetical protein|nr:hypothetical protein [Hyphomicrobiaceae bacterium]
MTSRKAFGAILVECARLVDSDGNNSVTVEFSNIHDEAMAHRLAMWINQLLKDHLQELGNEVIQPASKEAH